MKACPPTPEHRVDPLPLTESITRSHRYENFLTWIVLSNEGLERRPSSRTRVEPGAHPERVAPRPCIGTPPHSPLHRHFEDSSLLQVLNQHVRRYSIPHQVSRRRQRLAVVSQSPVQRTPPVSAVCVSAPSDECSPTRAKGTCCGIRDLLTKKNSSFKRSTDAGRIQASVRTVASPD